ncbi:MAG TPA: copper ion binding protein [Candidatus Limnocylindrales bacterium]|nr:copper ion binding protein [Candidatus Limnocylindrales bacterium]
MKTITTFSALILFLIGSFVLQNMVAADVPLQKTVLKIQGMVCEACPPKIKKALEGLDGVKKVEVSLEKAEAYVESEPGKVTTEQMIQAVDQAGFKASPAAENFSEITLKVENIKGPEDELKIKPALEKIEGVRKALVDAEKKEVFIDYLKDKVTVQQLTQSLTKLGYPPLSPLTTQVGDFLVTLQIHPKPIKDQEVHFDVILQSSDGKPVSDAEVQVDLSMPGMTMGEMRFKAEPAGEGRYTGKGKFSMEGKWRIAIRINQGGQKKIANFDMEVPEQ